MIRMLNKYSSICLSQYCIDFINFNRVYYIPVRLWTNFLLTGEISILQFKHILITLSL